VADYGATVRTKDSRVQLAMRSCLSESALPGKSRKTTMNISNMSKRTEQNDDNRRPMSNSPKTRKVEGGDDQTSIIGLRKLTHKAYTVGWICVLRSELNASRALLDEEHERLPLGEKDNSSYLLGRMGKHNVVIAFPRSGTYGTNSAAQTANNMVRTFRNIRFGLMVGVGGGAPRSPHPKDPLKDIRLGEVVVSDPKGNHGKHPAQRLGLL
jgi:hypothetical protein